MNLKNTSFSYRPFLDSDVLPNVGRFYQIFRMVILDELWGQHQFRLTKPLTKPFNRMLRMNFFRMIHFSILLNIRRLQVSVVFDIPALSWKTAENRALPKELVQLGTLEYSQSFNQGMETCSQFLCSVNAMGHGRIGY